MNVHSVKTIFSGTYHLRITKFPPPSYKDNSFRNHQNTILFAKSSAHPNGKLYKKNRPHAATNLVHNAGDRGAIRACPFGTQYGVREDIRPHEAARQLVANGQRIYFQG